VKIVRAIRKKILARHIIGSIAVDRNIGMVMTSMNCDITEDDYAPVKTDRTRSNSSDGYIDDIPDSDFSYQRAITITDTILNNLESRAMTWDKVGFNAAVTLSRGAQFSLYGPIPFLSYSISMQITATVQSLTASRKNYLLHHPQKSIFSRLTGGNEDKDEGKDEDKGKDKAIGEPKTDKTDSDDNKEVFV
jgi:hypothetical protein